MAWSRAIVMGAMGLIAALLIFPAAFSMPDNQFISMPTEEDHPSPPPAVSIADDLTTDYHADSCPDLRMVVRSAVEEALEEDITIAAGLLRLFFHDCFPQGCDASILLTGSRENELGMWPNRFLRRSAFYLIEEIRAKVHAACERTVSCADIIVLATHDVVVASGGKPYHVPLGRLDSFKPASRSSVNEIPHHTFNIDQLIASFNTRDLDETDLVVLSGAHTIGGARCTSFNDRFPEDSEFVRKMRVNCTSSTDPNQLQDLDVTTPYTFDNKYFKNLVEGKGVLTSDMQLLRNHHTGDLVTQMAREENDWWFWNQFGDSMSKMGMLRGAQGNVGEIRLRCFASRPTNTEGELAA